MCLSLSWANAKSQEADAIAYRQAYNQVLSESWDQALKSLEDFIKKYPQSEWRDDASFWKCYTQEKLDRPLKQVFACCQDFIQTYPESRWIDDAHSALIRVGERLVKSGFPEYEALVESLIEGEETRIRL